MSSISAHPVDVSKLHSLAGLMRERGIVPIPLEDNPDLWQRMKDLFERLGPPDPALQSYGAAYQSYIADDRERLDLEAALAGYEETDQSPEATALRSELLAIQERATTFNSLRADYAGTHDRMELLKAQQAAYFARFTPDPAQLDSAA